MTGSQIIDEGLCRERWASPSVAARQLPRGGSDFRSDSAATPTAAGGGLQAGRSGVGYLVRHGRAPLCHSVTSPPALRGERGKRAAAQAVGRGRDGFPQLVVWTMA